jgi:exopolysaccharide production protein ExoQ
MTASADKSVYSLVVTWVLSIPLVYLACQGVLWFQSARIGDLRARFGSLGSAEVAGESPVIAATISGILLLIVLSSMKETIRLCARERIFAILALFALASTMWSQYPVQSGKTALCLVADTLIAFYIYRRFSPAGQMQLFLHIGWICLIASIVMAVLLPKYGVSSVVGIAGAWRGIYVHRNLCAPVTVLFLSAAFFADADTMVAKCARGIYIGLSTIVVIMTQSRGGWVLLGSLFVCAAAIKITRRFSARFRTVFVVANAGVLSVLAVVGFLYSSNIAYLLGRDPTLTGRTAIWKALFASISKHPLLGYGYMAFWNGYQGESTSVSLATGWAVTTAHNGFLGVWVTLGAIGLAMVVLTLARALKDAFICLSASNMPYFGWCACVVILTLVGSIDEDQLMLPNDLKWVVYIVACVGLSEGARHLRSGLKDG